MSGANDKDWTQGPARFVAACVLGLAGIAGLAWTVMNAAPSSSGEISPPVEHLVDSAPLSQEQSDQPAGSDRLVRSPDSGDDHAEANQEATASDGGAEPSQAVRLARVIDINTATPAQLEQLPRIGPTLAQRIVDDRDANGPFGSLDELTRVRGIGEKTVDGLRGLAAAR